MTTRHGTAACNLCGSQAHAHLLCKNGHEVRRCAACGLVYIAPMPTPAQSAELYAGPYFSSGQGARQGISYLDYEAEAEVLSANFRARLAEMERLTAGAGGKVLDVGCAYGFFLKAARERGWETYGLEFSEHAAAYARDRLGLNVHRGEFFDDPLPGAPFDVITFWDTLEHLVNPVGALRRAHALLRPGGLIAVGTDDIGAPLARWMGADWYAIQPPWHTHHFSRATLRAALERAGFEVIEIRRRGKIFELRGIAARLTVFYPNRITGALYHWLSRAGPGRWPVHIDRGDWICAYARKPEQGSCRC